LDRETQSFYEFSIKAEDSSPFLVLSSEAKVQVNIEDVNDNRPFFEKHEKRSDYFISPQTKEGDFVLGEILIFNVKFLIA